jgi:magnesium-transporting ATPase (P-type)
VQFQLTINLVALVVAFVAAVTTGEMPLNVLQLLWVNLIMDALAALGNFSLPMRSLYMDQLFGFRLTKENKWQMGMDVLLDD